jgi:GNAT superfamily N-acetyltransferase
MATPQKQPKKNSMTAPYNITVRPTQAADLPAIRAMCLDVSLFSPEEVATVDELLDAYFTQGAAQSGYYFLSALNNDHVAGFACYGPRAITTGTYDLYWIVTAPSAARQGVGGHLLAAIEQTVAEQHGRIIIAETSGRADYINTRHFYLKYNYVAEAQLRDFYSPGDDLVIFVRRLPQVG